jgi:hypothetical protein
MANLRSKSSLIGSALFLFSLAVGTAGCGTAPTTCDLSFLDSSTQEICDTQAAAAGCDIPAVWSGITQFCSGVNCTACGGGHTD